MQNVTARWCSYPATVEGAVAGPEVPGRIQAAPGRATGGVTRRRGEVTARVTGTAASPSVRVDPSALVRDLDRKKVESGLKDLLKRFR